MHSELPELIKVNQRSSRNLMRRAPLVNGLFRPEEEHGSSGEDDVVPPMRRWHGKVGNGQLLNRCAALYFER